MNWILTVLLSALLVEAVLRMPLLSSALRIARTSRKAMHVLRSRIISVHWKERVMLVYSGRLILSTVTLAFLLAVLSGLIILGIFIAGGLGTGLGSFITSWPGILLSTAAAVGYLKVRPLLV